MISSLENGFPLAPRSYQPAAQALHDAYAAMLQSHPEAFDCIIYPARGCEHNEIVASNAPVGTLLDRDERAQEYDPPVQGRALIAPKQEPVFDAAESGLYESFHTAGEAMTLLLSISGLRRHSLVLWREYLAMDGEDTVERVVFISDEKPVGRTLGAQMLYVCYPLPAMGEMPEMEKETMAPEQPDPCPENPPDVGII